jgi:hypothetical protein
VNVRHDTVDDSGKSFRSVWEGHYTLQNKETVPSGKAVHMVAMFTCRKTSLAATS